MIKNSNKKSLGRRKKTLESTKGTRQRNKISLDEDAEDALYFSQIQEQQDAMQLVHQLQESLDKNRNFGYIEDFNDF